MLEHGLADQIADRPHVAHRGAALIVDAHEAAVHVDTHRFESPTMRAWSTADRNQHLLGIDGQ
jgi:hypothetical protein